MSNWPALMIKRIYMRLKLQTNMEPVFVIKIALTYKNAFPILPLPNGSS